MTNNLPPITIYTDGACDPNPGPGGWAAILLPPSGKPQELCGAETRTSNNQMELRAVIEALDVLPQPHRVTLYTDSQYLRQGITEWLPQWQARGWRTAAKQPVKNQALWQALEAAVGRHQIEWRWVKGHAGHKWNERADELARSMLPKRSLPLDDDAAIHIFAAASYLGKEKRGGWGVVLRYRDHTKMLSGDAGNTSANRMHLTAAIEGLRAVKQPRPIHFYTGADYLRDGITRWISGWQRRGWQTKSGKPVSNQDLWQKLLDVSAGYQIQWHLVAKNDAPESLQQAKQLADAAARGESSPNFAENNRQN